MLFLFVKYIYLAGICQILHDRRGRVYGLAFENIAFYLADFVLMGRNSKFEVMSSIKREKESNKT